MDGDVDAVYVERGLPFRSRYTPVIRSLVANKSASIKALAAEVGQSHSAMSQTISQMGRDGLVKTTIGEDSRERLVQLTPKAKKLLPEIEKCWAAFAIAIDDLSGQLEVRLPDVLEMAIIKLEDRSFRDRIQDQLGPPKRRRKRSAAA